MISIDLKGRLFSSLIKPSMKMLGTQLKPLRETVQQFLDENPDCPYR